jgi:hypothetical protein
MMLKDLFCSEHTSLHSVVSSLDLCNIQESSRTSCQHATWESQFRNGVIATLV